ncbi:hypothetical protein ACHAXT_001382 [Thalassiosira profunda]
MPSSRKRSQAKARKAKAEEAKGKESLPIPCGGDTLQLCRLINGVSLKDRSCHHWCENVHRDRKLQMVITMADTMVKKVDELCPDYNFAQICGSFLRGLADAGICKVAANDGVLKNCIECLTLLGIDYLLVTAEQARYTKMAAAIAMSISIFSDTNEAGTSYLNAILRGDQNTVNSMIAAGDIDQLFKDFYDDTERETIKYFAKIAKCSCLRAKYKRAKSQPKRGACWKCHAVKERKLLLECTGCRVHSYCSKECQRKDWPDHKEYCRLRMSERAKRGEGEPGCAKPAPDGETRKNWRCNKLLELAADD